MTLTTLPAAGAEGLSALEARLRQDLAWLELPARPWSPPRTHEGQPVLDVAVIGGGMAGMAAAATLGHLGLGARIFDRSPEGFEGPWATTARMETLRSPKQLTGPALGLPALTFRAWFEAQSGAAAWEALDKIPRLQWMDYLRWYRRVLGLDIRNGHDVTRVLPRADGLVALELRTPAGARTVLARRVVLATGRDGLGGAYVPPFAQALPRAAWAHSSDAFDYGTLRGKRVGVIGAGASAMDSAATALEAGAAGVDLLIRRADIPRVNKSKGAGSPGFTHGYAGLPDAWKWRIRHYINEQQVPPPRAGQEDQELSDSPDLGPAFEFLEATPGACPGLSRIHCFNYPAALTHGTVSGDIPAISDGARRLGQGIAALFYQEDIETHFANLEAYAEPEVFGDEWVPAPPPSA